MRPSIDQVRDLFITLQKEIVATLERLDGKEQFSSKDITYPSGGMSCPRVLQGGRRIEKAAVLFTHSMGDSLPDTATDRNPKLKGLSFQATAISLIVHPWNPYIPTTHMNLRFFLVGQVNPTWYFGGGFDLTPYYPFDEDIVFWHKSARDACSQHGDFYEELKKQCDEYFYLSHRAEHRGVGGIFFDDWCRGGFDASRDFVESVGRHFLNAYVPIFEKRVNEPWGEREEQFMLLRRGRYAEFNLLLDRGTRYGVGTGRRIESVLASLPPRVRWFYDFVPLAGSPEAALTEHYLQPRNWLEHPDTSSD